MTTTPLTLVIGNKNYSSWSMRPWLVMRQARIPFREVRIPLCQPDTESALAAWSPSGKVPALHHGETRVWDSLAICEYLADRFPEKALWPADPVARAAARSVSAEMHAGFAALRENLSMNIRARRLDKARTPETRADIARIEAIWNDCRGRFGDGGDMLFGRFSIADAMYAPVVLRFKTYGVALEGAAKAYAEALAELPMLQAWVAEAAVEAERIDQYERD
jgi:glutathione S-transferase